MRIYGQRLLNQDAEGGGKPPEGDPPPAADDPGAVTEPDDKAAPDADGLKSALQKEREQNKALKKDVGTLKNKMAEMAKQQQERDAALKKTLGLETDEDPTEALKRKADHNETLAKNALLISKVTAEAVAQGAVDPEAVAQLIDREGLEIDLEKMSVTGAAEAVKELLEKKPWLVKKAPEQPAGSSPPSSDPDSSKPDKQKLEELVKEAKTGNEWAQLQVSKNMKRIRELGIKV